MHVLSFCCADTVAAGGVCGATVDRAQGEWASTRGLVPWPTPNRRLICPRALRSQRQLAWCRTDLLNAAPVTMDWLRSVHFYRKVPRDLTEATTSGGTISLIASLVMAYLWFVNFTAYLTVTQSTSIVLDSSDEKKLQLNFNVTLHHLPCRFASLDIVDVMGTHLQNVSANILKTRVDASGRIVAHAPNQAQVGGRPSPSPLTFLTHTLTLTHLSPLTSHLSSFTFHPLPFTLHPSPFNLHPSRSP